MKELNSYKKLPHYVITDNPSDFYIFRRLHKNEFGVFSGWIKGRAELWHKLHNMKNKKEFMNLCDKILEFRPNSPLGKSKYV